MNAPLKFQLHKHIVKRSITITLPLDIAETLQGLVDGCIGSSIKNRYYEC